MRRLLALAAALFLWVSLAHAETLSDGDRTAFQTIITGQLEAFRADDGARAYSYAAPMIRRTFPTPDTFMAMVQKGYPPVYRPRSYRFGEASLNASGSPIQRVTIEGPDSITYEAIYTMQQQPDGTWQINGCALVKSPELGA